MLMEHAAFLFFFKHTLSFLDFFFFFKLLHNTWRKGELRTEALEKVVIREIDESQLNFLFKISFSFLHVLSFHLPHLSLSL